MTSYSIRATRLARMLLLLESAQPISRDIDQKTLTEMIGITRSRVSYLEIWLDERAVDRNNLPIEPTNAELRLVPIGFCDASIFASAIRIPAKQQGLMLEETDNAFTIRDGDDATILDAASVDGARDANPSTLPQPSLLIGSCIRIQRRSRFRTNKHPSNQDAGYCLDVHRLSPLSRRKSSISGPSQIPRCRRGHTRPDRSPYRNKNKN